LYVLFRPAATRTIKENGLHFRVRMDVVGHNNTEINPVFRGMVFAGSDYSRCEDS